MNLDHTSLAALQDARRNARASLAAVRAMNLAGLHADDFTALSRLASQLADAIADLERIEHAARLQP